MSKSHEKIRRTVEEEFPELLKNVFGQDLGSVILYGSYVRGNYSPGVSDINVLIILEKVDEAKLQKFGILGHRLMRKQNVTPLVMSRGEFQRSADVFPMEYLDISARHKVLYGPDETEGLEFSKNNLRHQLEHQLRGNLMALRQLLVASRNRRRFLKAELKAWYGPMAALFRSLLRLRGVERVPENQQELIQQVNQSFNLEPGPFLSLLSLRAGENTDPLELGQALAMRLSSLVDIVDQLETGA